MKYQYCNDTIRKKAEKHLKMDNPIDTIEKDKNRFMQKREDA